MKDLIKCEELNKLSLAAEAADAEAAYVKAADAFAAAVAAADAALAEYLKSKEVKK